MRIFPGFYGRFVVAVPDGDHISVSIALAMRSHIGLRLHKRAAWRILQKQLRDFVDAPRYRESFDLPPPASGRSARRLEKQLRMIDGKLESLTRMPIGPVVLQKLLRISAEERRRWTRQQRLIPSGRGFFKTAQLISFAIYSADQVDQLLKNPDIIADWRARDTREIASEAD